MMVNYGPAVAVLLGGAAGVVAIVAAIVKWRTANGVSRRKFVGPLKVALIGLVIGMLYFVLFDHTPRGTECQKSRSPNGLYTAERCLLDWVPGANSEYVGRVFDAKNGKKLAQHTFSTPVPEIAWYSYQDVYVSFSNGDGGDDATYILLPPSRWDRLLAARPGL